jgi:guanine deaminase
MYLEDEIGSIAPAMEADVVVLDMRSTPIIDYQMQFAESFDEALFIQMTLGDDRAVKATYVAGKLVYRRDQELGRETASAGRLATAE